MFFHISVLARHAKVLRILFIVWWQFSKHMFMPQSCLSGVYSVPVILYLVRVGTTYLKLISAVGTVYVP